MFLETYFVSNGKCTLQEIDVDGLIKEIQEIKLTPADLDESAKNPLNHSIDSEGQHD